MSDLPFVAPGDPKPRSAGVFNELISAARKSKTTDLRTPPARDIWFGPQDTIRVHNDTGSALTGRFPIVGLVEPIFLPDVDNAAEHCFLQTPCFSIEYPCSDTYRGRFAVVQGPLIDGRVGTAILSGKFASLVDDAVVAGDSVDIDETARADDDSLSVVSGGIAKCIWAGSGTGLPSGTKWGLMRFGGGGGGGGLFIATLDTVDCAEGTATGTLTRAPCGETAPEGTIDIEDDLGCFLVGAEELLIGKKCIVQKMDGETINPYTTGCPWIIINMCCDSFSC